MGCDNTSTVEDSSNEKKKDNNNEDDNISNKSDISDDKEKGEEKTNIKDNKLKSNEKEEDPKVLSTEENKSNVISCKLQNDNKINLHKQEYEGVTLMKGIEDSIPDNLNEEDIYQLVKAAINYRITDNESDKKNTITKAQVKAIASILYNQINKNDGKKCNNDKIDIKNYPELKGMNIKIGAEKLTKDIIRKMMFHDKKVDECQIDLTYANLTRENDDIKALMIEII